MLSFVRWRSASHCVVRACAGAAFLLTSLSSVAATVHGTVRDALNHPVGNVAVDLVRDGKVLVSSHSKEDGAFELTTPQAGRFSVHANQRGFAAYISHDFYSGAQEVIARDITLSIASAQESVSVTATGLPTPLEQVSAAVHLIPHEEMETRAYVVPELRLQPGVNVVQAGQNGAASTIFVRGANSDANKILIDGVPANDVGGVFDLGLLSPTGIGKVEIHRGPDSVLYGSDALGSVITIETPRGHTAHPVLNYSGDAGNFHTWRNEVELSGAHLTDDYYAAFSRFDSSNALPEDRVHLSTAAVNVGHALSSSAQIRGTVRHSVSASGVPNAHDFYGISAHEKQGDQQTAISGVVEGTYRNNWHNLVRYYANRKRQQDVQFAAAGLAHTVHTPFYDYLAYFGNTVMIRGANGFSATGRASINYDQDYPAYRFTATNRDGVQFQSDYRFTPHLSALAGFRYEDERGSNINTAAFLNQKLERRNYDYSLQLQGDVSGRLFYSLGGAVQKNYLFGTEGTPRLGIAWYPVAPSSSGFLQGTKLHFNFSKGVQEPNLVAQLGQLSTLLEQVGAPTQNVRPLGAQRIRTYEGGIDQNILGKSLVIRLNYFHNQFGRQVEYVYRLDIQANFNVTIPPSIYGAYLNSLDFKAQGLEAEAEWRANGHLSVRGGYTYLDAIVQRSYSSDVTAAAGGFPTTNPNLPGIAIGASSPLRGARPFRRPPHTGYVVATYAHGKWSGAVKSVFVSRADDSTFLSYSDFKGDNTLLLPNHNLDFAYQRIDADVRWNVTSHVSLFTQLNNLLGQQHMGPIGFSALPFNFRSGVKMSLGGD
ncbi:MAG: TonB-dependent receptor plug domain-containing protein [Acidobacteria bacterium]|nr:TonB-dependent receptor plug domain-containing protein [Acidobacteriota bacterium]